MTSEEIIQRLLDEKKITVKEAMVILKDLAKIGLQQILPEKIFPDTWIEDPLKRTNPGPFDNIVVMYGVTTNPYTYVDDNNATTISGSTNAFGGDMVFWSDDKNNKIEDPDLKDTKKC